MKHYAEIARDRVARLFGIGPKKEGAGDGIEPRHETDMDAGKEGKTDGRKR